MQDSNSPRPSAPKASRRIRIVLGLSLAANLAVVGLIAGAVLRQGDGPRGGPRSAGFTAYGLPYMIALPREDRKAIKAAVRSGREGAVPDRAARRALYRDVLGQVRAVPFDAAGLAAALERQSETAIEVQKAAQAAWLDVVAGMTDAERNTYAQQVEEVLRRGPKARK